MEMLWTNLSKRKLIYGRRSGCRIRRAIDHAILLQRYGLHPWAWPGICPRVHTIRPLAKPGVHTTLPLARPGVRHTIHPSAKRGVHTIRPLAKLGVHTIRPLVRPGVRRIRPLVRPGIRPIRPLIRPIRPLVRPGVRPIRPLARAGVRPQARRIRPLARAGVSPRTRPLLDYTGQVRGKTLSSLLTPPIEQLCQPHRCIRTCLPGFFLIWSHSHPRRSWTCDFKVKMATRCHSPCKVDSGRPHGGSSLKYLAIPVRNPTMLNGSH